MPKPDRQLELQCLYFPLIQPKLTEVDGVGGWGVLLQNLPQVLSLDPADQQDTGKFCYKNLKGIKKERTKTPKQGFPTSGI